MSPSSASSILLTGATGYVGGRLRHRLEADPARSLVCLARRPDHLRGGVAPETRLVAGDVLDAASLPPALRGIDIAFYLIHSMGARGSFAELDRAGARNFARAARAAGVRRVIYLGGLGHSGAELSDHLRSRQEVGEILRHEGPPVIELRASIVLGSGSLSFEMIRALVERLPVMTTPRWVSVRAQPIAIDDLLDYLVAALDLPGDESRIIAIGGADRVSYGEIMMEYARQRGLRRWMIPLPVLTPHLSSLWLGLVTPLYAQIGRKLIDGLRHETVVEDDAARRVFAIEPCGMREAIRRALEHEEREFALTRWSDALSSTAAERDWTRTQLGPRIVESHVTEVSTDAAAAFAPIRRIGGRTGWYAGRVLWTLRGWLDLLAGGVGMRRGRRDPAALAVGDVVDCWRVEQIEADRRLRLRAEMKLPGRAWLEFEVESLSASPEAPRTRIRQTAVFDPLGLSGQLYWYALYPLHQWVFRAMLRGIARAAATSR
ncbi:MAG: DUF2867 domain-containing protein [Candidatus Eisenbacteria bacterium]|nr:DUF2867 domain-containing protein [Candidatus Eisenbacteria bacterium]